MQRTQSKPIDVEDFLNCQPFGSFHWLVFSICVIVVILDGFDTAAIGDIAPSLVTEWHIAKPDLAPVLGAALFGLVFGALLAGPLADRLGRKRVLTGAIVLMGIACLLAASCGVFSHDSDRLAIPHRPRPRRRYAERRDADERILPSAHPSADAQCNVLWLSVRRLFGRLPCGLDDPTLWLAQRTGVGRRRAACSHVCGAFRSARICALHGRAQLSCRAYTFELRPDRGLYLASGRLHSA